MTLLADDAIQVPTPFDQLPDQAWNFGPLFVIIAFMLVTGFGLAWYIVRRMDKHLTDAGIAVRGHLKESETTQKEGQLTQQANQSTLQVIQSTLQAMEIRISTGSICRYPDGSTRPVSVIEQPSGQPVG